MTTVFLYFSSFCVTFLRKLLIYYSKSLFYLKFCRCLFLFNNFNLELNFSRYIRQVIRNDFIINLPELCTNTNASILEKRTSTRFKFAF